MKFLMNNREWEIKELSQEDMRKTFTKYDGEPKEGRYFGLTYLDSGKIYIDKDLCIGQKKQTLMHELMHCYIGCYIDTSDNMYNEEALCNISANSHDIIHEIVEEYFKPTIHIDLSSQDLSKYAVEGKFGKDEGWKEIKLQ